MTSRALGLRGRAWELGLLALVAAWATTAAAPDTPLAELLGLGRQGLEGLVVVPAIVALALVLRPSERALRVAAAIVAIVLAAAVLVPYVAREPTAALVAPALAVSAILCGRFPAAAVTAAALIAGFHGTIEAHTAIPPRTLVDGVIGGIVLSSIWRILVRGRTQRAQPRVAALLLSLYVVASALAALAAPNIVAGLQAFRAGHWYLLAALALGFAVWSGEHRRRMLHGLLAVNLAVASYAVLRWITGPTDAEAENAFLTQGLYNILDGELRLVGSFAAASDLAAWMAVAVPFCAIMTLALRDRWRWVAMAVAAMGVAVMLETGIRVAAVGVVPAVLVVIVLYALGNSFGPRRLVAAYTALAFVLVGGGAAFSATVLSDPSARERYERLLDPFDDPSFKARQIKWEAAIRDVESRPFGLGLATGGATALRYGRFVTAGTTSIDSSYLKVAVEQGFLVLLLLVAALVALLVTCAVSAVHGRDPTRAAILAGTAGAITAWLVIFYAGNFIEGQSSLNGYLMIALALSALADPKDA